MFRSIGYHMVRRHVARFTSANLPKPSVTIRELCKPTYKIIILEAVEGLFCDNGNIFSISRSGEVT
jgi:hypothetical protein